MQKGARDPFLARFETFVLNLRTGELRNGNGKVIRLPEQSFQILAMLIERPGEIVTREEIRKRLWPNDTVVEFEHSISAAMNRLRQALGDSAGDPSYIETLARRGYRWLRPVDWTDEKASEPAPSSLVPSAGLIGRKVSHYRVLEFVGGGGMGIVYKAEDIKLARRVALKFLPEELSGDQHALERFEREARAASALNHPNICTIYEIDEHEGQPFIVMEFLEGDTLREVVSSNASHKPLEVIKLLELAAQIAGGLEAAHEKGIIHRDVKPSNIFVTHRGVAKILDFGIAKLLEPDSAGARESEKSPPQAEAAKLRSLHLTRTGAALGTEGYMSPEQVRSEDLDARTDLFSFGLVLYEMATGQRAFTGETAAIVQDAIVHREPPPVRQLAADVPSALESIITKALEKDRARRYQTSAEMRADLDRILTAIKAQSSPAGATDGSVNSSASVESPAPIRTPILSPVRIGTAVAALLIAGVTVGFFWWTHFRSAHQGEWSERQLTINSNDNPVFDAEISGDGKYLAFSDSLGIHVKLLQTGETHDIAQPAEFRDTQVSWRIRWLPDSTRFLAASILNKDDPPTTWQASVVGGTLHKVLDDALVMSVSPDGNTVAFTRVWRRELWLMGPNGETPRKLYDAGEKNSYWSIVWSPDGTRLLYMRNDWSGRDLQVTMETRGVKGGPVTKLLSDGRLRSLHWLPDGRVLYVLGEPDVSGDTCNYWVTRINQSTGKFSVQPAQLSHSVGYCMSSTSSTADSRRLVFLKQSHEYSVYVAGLSPRVTSITPPKHVTLTTAEEFPSAWSPDSKSIIFVSNRDRTWGFYRQPLEEAPATPIVTGIDSTGLGAIFPRMSPDGKWLIWAAYRKGYDPGVQVDLLRVSVAGGPIEKILSDAMLDTPRCAQFPVTECMIQTYVDRTHAAFISFDPVLGRGHEVTRYEVEPEWSYVWALSPDASKIAIMKQASGDIHVLSLATRTDEKITVQHWNNLQSLDWTSDGKGFFTSSLQPSGVLLHVDLHGHANVLWEPKGVSMPWAVPSPDGRYVAMPYFAHNSNAWLLENF